MKTIPEDRSMEEYVEANYTYEDFDFQPLQRQVVLDLAAKSIPEWWSKMTFDRFTRYLAREHNATLEDMYLTVQRRDPFVKFEHYVKFFAEAVTLSYQKLCRWEFLEQAKNFERTSIDGDGGLMYTNFAIFKEVAQEFHEKEVQARQKYLRKLWIRNGVE